MLRQKFWALGASSCVHKTPDVYLCSAKTIPCVFSVTTAKCCVCILCSQFHSEICQIDCVVLIQRI